MKRKVCRNCKLPCPLKDEGKKKKWNCKIPEAKRMVLEAASNPQKLLDSLFSDVFTLQTIAKTFIERERVFQAKLSLKKEVSPNVQEIRLDHRQVSMDFNQMRELYEKHKKPESE